MILPKKRDLLLEWAESLHPSSKPKGDTLKYPSSKPKGDTVKKGTNMGTNRVSPKINMSRKTEEKEIPFSKRILAILISRHPYAYRICEIHKRLIGANIEIKYDTVKKTIQRFKKYGYIRERPPNYYSIIDVDKATDALSNNRVPYKGTHPDNETPYQFINNGDTTASIFHAIRFKKVNVPHHIFINFRDDGKLIRPKNNSKSRQWRYYGECYDIHISEKTKRAWGVLKKLGWQQEVLLDFGPEIFSQIKDNISCHVAIEDKDIEYRFIRNDKLGKLKETFDNGSQLNVREREFEGPLEDVNTAQMFVLNPTLAVNKLDYLKSKYHEIYEALFRLWRTHDKMYLDLKKDVNELPKVFADELIKSLSQRESNHNEVQYHG